MKTAYHHGDLKNALLDAADEILLSKGLQGFTMRACARLANVSHAAPKHHFGDINGLLTEVAMRGFDRLVTLLQDKMQPVMDDLHAQMYAVGLAYVEFAEAYPEHFRIMFRKDLLSYNTQSPPRQIAVTYATLINVVLRQRGEPEISEIETMASLDGEVIKDIFMCWSNIPGYAHLRLEGQLNSIPEETHLKILQENTKHLSDLVQKRAT